MSDPVADPAPAPRATLSDRPDWRYLLRDFYELYRHLPAGGSARIRAHQRAVRERIAKVIKANPPVADLPPWKSP